MLYILSLFAGLVLAVQNPYNVNLGKQLSSPILAGFMTYIIGTIEFLIALFVLRINVISVLSETFQKGFPWFIGGVLGAIYITSIIILFPKLGPIKAVIYPTLGQVTSGILIDAMGWFNVQQSPLNMIKIIGLVLLIIGVILSAYTPKVNKLKDVNSNNWLLCIWGFVAGILSTIQGIFNGNLGTLLHETAEFQNSAALTASIASSFIAFLFGTLLLLIVVSVNQELTPGKFVFGARSGTAWAASSMGAFFVLCMTILNPTIGPGLTVSLSIIGLMIGSIIIEHNGLFQVPKNKTTQLKIISVAVFTIGIIIIKFVG